MATLWSQVQQGRLRVPGVAKPRTHSTRTPGVPAVAETVPAFEALTRTSRTSASSLKAATPAGDKPAEFPQFIKADRTRWEKVAGRHIF